ncbi:hypothetical protein JCM6882_001188 [Rhodosporidiobolus microsporus]
MQALQGRRRRERLPSSPAQAPSDSSHSLQPETPLFASVDLSATSPFSPVPSSSASPPTPSRGPHSSSPNAEDWTTTLDAVAASSASSAYRSSAGEGGRRPGKMVRKARSAAEWSTASSSSLAQPAVEDVWATHVARRPPLPPLKPQRSLSLSLPPPSSPSAASSSAGSFIVDSPRPDSSQSRRSARRSPSLPSMVPRPPSAAVSWRGRHQSYTVGGDAEVASGAWKLLRGRGSTLSLKALMGVGGAKGEGEMDERLLLPPEPEKRRKITKGSWEYQVTESLLHGGTPPSSVSRSPARTPRQRPSLTPLNYGSTSTANAALLSPPPAVLVQSPSKRDLGPPLTHTRSTRSRSSSLDSSSSDLSFHSAASFAPFPVLFPAQDPSYPASPAAATAEPPFLHAVKSPARASLQYSIRAKSLTRASLSSLTSLRPLLEPTCVIDLTILNDVPERTEAGTTVSFADSGTVVIPFSPQSPLTPALGSAGAGASTHLFPPSPPVPLASQKQPNKLARAKRVEVGAWLFVVGFVCPIAWWVGAVWPRLEGEGQGKKARRVSGLGEKGIEGGKEKLSSSRSSPSKYTNFPRSRVRSRAESAVSRLLDGPSAVSSAATHQQAAVLVWRRRNRMASAASVFVIAAVVAFAAWGATR